VRRGRSGAAWRGKWGAGYGMVGGAGGAGPGGAGAPARAREARMAWTARGSCTAIHIYEVGGETRRSVDEETAANIRQGTAGI